MKPQRANPAFEPVDFILAHAEGSLAGTHRAESHLGGELLLAIDVMGHALAVISERDPIPATGGMHSLRIDQGLSDAFVAEKGVEPPAAVAIKTGFDHHAPIGRILNMHKALFGQAAFFWFKKNFDGELRPTGQRVSGHEEAVMRTVKK